MKLFEIRLYKIKVINDKNVLFEGNAEDLPDDLKEKESKNITLENGMAVIEI